jgi:predicted PP-loop superfamily ATPase
MGRAPIDTPSEISFACPLAHLANRDRPGAPESLQSLRELRASNVDAHELCEELRASVRVN